MSNPFALHTRAAVLPAFAAAVLCALLHPAPAVAADDPLDPAILKKAKAASARLKVTLPDDTVIQGTVSGTRKTATGYTQTQLAGGLHPGNSGGPVLSAKGAVVGIAVSGLKDTQIHFAVPVSYVHAFLGGRTHRWLYGVPYKD